MALIVDIQGDLGQTDPNHYAYVKNKGLYPTMTYCNAWYAQKGMQTKNVTATTYTLLLADKGFMIFLNSASAITLTVPSGLPVDFTCGIVQDGAGIVTIVAGSGVTVTNVDGFTKTKGQTATVSIFSRPIANTFITVGSMQ